MRFPDFNDEWQETTLGEILSIGSGRDYKHLSRGDIPVFGTGGYMTSVDQFLMNGESVFIGRKGTIDKPFYYNGKFWTVDTLFYTHSFVNSYPRFVLYLFSNINWLEYNEASGVPSLSKTTISKIPICLPQLVEQKRIADFLSLIDGRIQSCSETIKELKTQKAGLLNQLFSQKLRFPDFNDEWTQTTLGEICSVLGGGTPRTEIQEYWNGNIQWFTPSEIGLNKFVSHSDRTITTEGLNNSGAKLLPIGTILLTTRATIGEMSIATTPCTTNQGFQSLVVDSRYTTTEFIYQKGKTLKNELFTRAQEKDHKRHYISEVQPLSISLPTLEEQKKIADFLSLIDERIEVEEQLLKKYEEQKKYLLRHMFV